MFCQTAGEYVCVYTCFLSQFSVVFLLLFLIFKNFRLLVVVRCYPACQIALWNLLIFSSLFVCFFCPWLSHVYIHTLFFLPHEFNQVVCLCMLLAIFVGQPRFRAIAAFSGWVYGAMCCRYLCLYTLCTKDFCTAGLAFKVKKKDLSIYKVFNTNTRFLGIKDCVKLWHRCTCSMTVCIFSRRCADNRKRSVIIVVYLYLYPLCCTRWSKISNHVDECWPTTLSSLLFCFRTSTGARTPCFFPCSPVWAAGCLPPVTPYIWDNPKSSFLKRLLSVNAAQLKYHMRV